MYFNRLSILFFFVSTLILGSSCSYHPGFTKKDFRKSVLESKLFANEFTGFALYDIEKEKMIYEENSSKYFTPASNIKLFTFYAGLKLLGDSIPGLKYTLCNDSLIFRGTGDPSFLHPSYPYSCVYDFLRSRNEKFFYSTQKYSGESLGPGWAWDWFKYSYFTEKAAFPIYGNLVRFNFNPADSLPVCKPAFFSKFIQVKDEANKKTPIVRDMSENLFFYYNGDVQQNKSKLDIPFKYSPDLLVDLLADTLKYPVGLIEKKKCSFEKTIYSVPSDSIYKKMLQESDNFIAEQLLLVYSSEILDSLNSEMAINFIKDSLFKDAPDKFIWVDGSGLSRYNLVTPRTMVYLLKKIHQQVPQDKLFQLLPSGGVSGTLKDYYKGDNGPFLFAKSGSLSNNSSLSGYIITKSGKPLIFSFLHNNHVASAHNVRKEMEKVLKEIYNTY